MCHASQGRCNDPQLKSLANELDLVYSCGVSDYLVPKHVTAVRPACPFFMTIQDLSLEEPVK